MPGRRGLEGRWRYLSGYPRPPKNDVSGYRRAKADAELVAVARLPGYSEAVLNDPSLMQMLLPVVRADFLVTGSYRHRRMGRWTRRCTCSVDARTACAAPSCSAGCMRPGATSPRPARRAALFIREQQGSCCACCVATPASICCAGTRTRSGKHARRQLRAAATTVSGDSLELDCKPNSGRKTHDGRLRTSTTLVQGPRRRAVQGA